MHCMCNSMDMTTLFKCLPCGWENIKCYRGSDKILAAGRVWLADRSLEVSAVICLPVTPSGSCMFYFISLLKKFESGW